MKFPRQTAQPGFALVVALALMAFLLLLLVALSSLVQIETQRTKAELNQFEARQNALLGLRLAVAQLQSEAGVDRVATARADGIGVVVTPDQLEDPDFDSTDAVHPAKQYWTGVFPADPDLSPAAVADLGRWLVSGNAFGKDAVREGESNPARLMSFSVGSGLEEVVVEAPREAIIDGRHASVRGHFAYWVADESVKAKVNLVNPLAAADVSDGSSFHQFAAAQRFGAERMDGLGGLAALYDREDAATFDPWMMDRIAFVADLPLSGLTEDSLNLGSKSLDLTTQSWGVLSDSRFGGLKMDLTTHLDRPARFEPYHFIVPEDIEDWVVAGSPTRVSQMGVLLRHARGPSWALLQDFAHIHRELGLNGDRLVPRIGEGGGPPQSGQSMANFPETMTIAPVLLYQGLGFGMRLTEVMGEEIGLTELDRTALAALAVSDEHGGIPNSVVQSNPAIELFDRSYHRIHLTIEPVVALWNPYDVRLEAYDYLVEFSFSNGLWGAQPAMYMRNTALSEWIHMHATESPTTTLVHNPNVNRWYVFPDERGVAFDSYEDHFSSLEMDFIGTGSAADARLETWNFHLTEVLPDFVAEFQNHMEFDTYGRHRSPYNAYFSSGSSSAGAKVHNLHFAMRNVALEPGEIKWFSLRGSDLDYTPANRILEEGFHGGTVSMPISPSVGWRAQSRTPIDDDDTGGGTYRYLPSSYRSGSFQRRGTWVDQDDQERPWMDVGLVVWDVPLAGSTALRHMGSEGFDIGLGHRSGQYAINLRMLDPVLHEGGGDFETFLDEPFGDGGASGRENDIWKALRYVNVGPGGNSAINLASVGAPTGWRRDMLSTGVFMMSPNREEVNFRDGEHNAGVKILSAHNVLSRYHGWNSLRDPSQGATGSERAGYGTSSPTYGFALEMAPTYAFDQYQLWHEASIVRDSVNDPEYRAVLFHLPRDELFSIGQFQHLPISRTQWDPTYVVGNSFASPWIPSDDTWIYYVRTTSPDPLAANFTLHDRSYLINNALADSTFFSTWRPDDSAAPLNPRLIVFDPLRPGDAPPDETSIAARIMVNGPFNVNSTSVEAWKAVLGAMNHQALQYRDVGGEGGVYPEVERASLTNPFLRSPRPTGGTAQQPDGGSFPMGDSAYWRGFREIDDDQIAELAEAIVTQVRDRGPFRAVAEFLNRRLGPESSPEALRGAVQAAIDAQSASSDRPINPDVFGGNVTPSGGSVINTGNYVFPAAALGARHEGAPGFLMQADIVGPLMPFLTARGDTFIVRSYGDVVVPGTTDSVSSRIWCEAVVQRMPEYIDTTDGAEVAPDELVSDLNLRFGRRFVIRSLRWLSDDEI